MIFDDHRVPRRTLEEIEAEANRCRSRVRIGEDGRIDLDELLKVWGIGLAVRPDAQMRGAEAHSNADARQIVCRRRISQGLRFGDPNARNTIGHELGHMFLHRGASPKPRMIAGNQCTMRIDKEESAEDQAWKFSRALFITREDLEAGEPDEALAVRLGIPDGAVELRRKDVQNALSLAGPRIVPLEATKFLNQARHEATTSDAARKAAHRAELAKQVAWNRAAQISNEDPREFRLAHGFKIQWSHHERGDSHYGWTIMSGEARAYLDLKSG
jgi:hypothetical protein